MKRKILMASAAMILSMAAFAGNGTNNNGCCKGSTCSKVCSKKCACDSKKCSPETCKSATCGCHK